MKNFFKRATALVLVVSMMLGTSVFAAAPDMQDTGYLPLRATVEHIGSVVEWDYENARIVITHKDDVFIFRMSSNIGYVNDEQFYLEFNIVENNNRAYISYVDAARLFGIVQDVNIVGDDTEPVALGEFAATTAAAIALVTQMMEQFSIPGVTVALVDAETGFTWTQGFGYADTETGRLVDAYTMFPVGSSAKPFTAMAVMQLVEQGIIDLDEPIVTYIPEFSQLPNPLVGGNYENITVRMLLSNTSGIVNNVMAGMSTAGRHYPNIMNNFLEVLPTQHMDTVESTRFIYANAGWTLLGILVARMAGYDNYFDGFISYTNQNIFEPMGMDMSSFEITSRHMPYMAMPYDYAGLRTELGFTNALSAGSLVSNANEMAIFMHTILGGGTYNDTRVLTEASVNQMLTLHNFDFSLSPQMRYGLGFLHLTHIDGFQTVGHGGTILQHHTEMVFNRESSIGVFVSTNSVSGMFGASAMGSAILQSAIMEKTGTLPLLPTIADADATVIELSEEELQVFEGFYVVAGDMWIIETSGSALSVNSYGMPGMEITLTPMSDGSFDSIIGRLWFEEMHGEIVMLQGDHKIGLVGSRADKDIFAATDDFTQWLGTYYPVPVVEGEVFTILSKTFAINEWGLSVVIMDTVYGISQTSPFFQYDGIWFVGTNPLTFTMEDDVASFDFLGATFVRE